MRLGRVLWVSILVFAGCAAPDSTADVDADVPDGNNVNDSSNFLPSECTIDGITTGANVDSDEDGLTDCAEVHTYATDPSNVDTDGDGLSDGDEIIYGTNPNNSDSDGDGIPDLLDSDTGCAGSSQEGTQVSRPVDIIFIIDNSGSMSAEIADVELNINENFAGIIADSGIDFNVIMIARHGNHTNQRICVAAPLSGTTCNPIPMAPVENSSDPDFAGRFHHCNLSINSFNSLSQAQNSYASGCTWSQYLRPEALKVFVEISDDEACYSNSHNSCPDAANDESELFKTWAFAPDKNGQFGTLEQPNFVFHSIVGVAPNTANVDGVWSATDPFQDPNNGATKCASAATLSIEYQQLSIFSGGLRYSICVVEQNPPGSYNAVFNKIAEGVIEGSQLPCTFELPEAPEGENLDLNKVIVAYVPSSDGNAVLYQNRDSEAACSGTGFYVADDKIVLCPDSCEAVQSDPQAQVVVNIACEAVGGSVF